MKQRARLDNFDPTLTQDPLTYLFTQYLLTHVVKVHCNLRLHDKIEVIGHSDCHRRVYRLSCLCGAKCSVSAEVARSIGHVLRWCWGLTLVARCVMRNWHFFCWMTAIKYHAKSYFSAIVTVMPIANIEWSSDEHSEWRSLTFEPGPVKT